MCLQCGSRVALGYRRPPSWRVPVVIVIAVLLLAVAGTAVALNKIGDDASREVDRTPIKAKQPKEAPAASAPASATGLVERGALYGWPRHLRAFTVVLRSVADRASAESFARSASEGRPAKIGVIHADDFKSLPKGSFVVFAGQYKDRPTADRAAARLRERFAGSSAQLVER